MVLERAVRVVPGPVEGEEVRILDQQRVEAAKELIVLDHVVIGPDVCKVALLDQIPMIEIETAARHPERLPGRRERRGGCHVKDLRPRRVDAGAAFAPATRLASFEKSKN